jgi:hypothetical protein
MNQKISDLPYFAVSFQNISVGYLTEISMKSLFSHGEKTELCPFKMAPLALTLLTFTTFTPQMDTIINPASAVENIPVFFETKPSFLMNGFQDKDK